MCDNDATSMEHVPPKCLFPVAKDVDGENYRKELITVPSCYLHNSAKSKDDEFLMVSLAGIFGNNSIGYKHKLTKVNRAIKRTSNRLLDKAFIKRKHYHLRTDNGFLEVIWGTPDHVRLIDSLKHIAYGLHYHHLKKRFNGQLKVVLGYLHSEDTNNNTFVKFVKEQAAKELSDTPAQGSNKDIFTYKFAEPDVYGSYLLSIKFYGGIDIYVSFLPEDKKGAFDFNIAIMRACDKVVFKSGDKEYIVKGN